MNKSARKICILTASVIGIGLGAMSGNAAAAPGLSVSGTHTSISANGTGFNTKGVTVYLYAFGLNAGKKTLITIGNVVPLQKSEPIPPCLFGVLCNAGAFVGPSMNQPHDPCYAGQGGFKEIEVDAMVASRVVASRRATVTCPVTQ